MNPWNMLQNENRFHWSKVNSSLFFFLSLWTASPSLISINDLLLNKFSRLFFLILISDALNFHWIEQKRWKLVFKMISWDNICIYPLEKETGPWWPVKRVFLLDWSRCCCNFIPINIENLFIIRDERVRGKKTWNCR